MKATLLVASVLFLVGFDRTGRAPGHAVTQLPSDHGADTGLAGYPESNPGTKAYADSLKWGKRHWKIWWFEKQYQDSAVVCNHATRAQTVRLRIQPEKRSHKFSRKDLETGHGRFVARITNLDEKIACEDWDLQPTGVAYMWMGRDDTGALMVRIYRENSLSGVFEWTAGGPFGNCEDGDHGAALAKWNKPMTEANQKCFAEGLVTHNQGWVSCSGGCCYAQSLGLLKR